MSDDADALTTQGHALTTQYAVKAQESVLLNKTLFDSPAEKSQIKRYPSCESVVSKGSRHSSVFSGTDPVPTGEESFESWRDSTVVSVRDWTGPETTMRRKILESLHSPSVDVVKSYMVGHPDATSCDLIEVLEVTFGPVESTTEMLYDFHSTFQKEKEDLSAYLVQLEQCLRLLVSRSAITDDEMDSLRIRQLKRGTLNSDPVAVTIRAHYQDKLPPEYVALMERVRREEADAYVRACQGIQQVRTLLVCPRGECRGHEESFHCLSACDIIQPSCWISIRLAGNPKRAMRASVSSCKTA
ncbi:hypothetical protein XELAEV_18009469mg, partial [Xenopus laevis]